MTAALKMSRTSPDKKVKAALSKIKPELYDCRAKRNQISTVEALCLITFQILWHLNVNSSVRNTAASMFFTYPLIISPQRCHAGLHLLFNWKATEILDYKNEWKDGRFTLWSSVSQEKAVRSRLFY